ncbi:MAG: bacterial Ig-like domain-containing protein [Eubacteriales bacterium]|nr:bacterial Ig-like domain-containing protein [Eubacteriales bacterium]
MKKSVIRFAARVLTVALTAGSILGAPVSVQAQTDRGAESDTVQAVVSGTKWYDTDGERIQAHGGQMFRADADGTGEKWWWVGEDKSEGRIPIRGVHLYSSDDMYSWTDEGTILPAFEKAEDVRSAACYEDYTDEQCEEVFFYFNERNCIIERPKLLYNEKTDKWVLWYHSDGPDSSGNGRYSRNLIGVAVSDEITGPYQFIGAAKAYGNGGVAGQGDSKLSNGGSGDMTVFKDDDGTAYLIYVTSKDGTNNAMSIAKLNESYTGLVTDKNYGEEGYKLFDSSKTAVSGKDFFYDVLNEKQREAPAVFKYKDTYYMGVSTTGGWNPSFTTLFRSKTMLGRWEKVSKSLFSGTDTWEPDEPYMTSIAGKKKGFSSTADNSFSSQITYVVPLDAENGLFLYMGDRWWDPDTYGKAQGYTDKNSDKYGFPLSDARYVWLPFTMNEDGTMNRIEMRNSWTTDELKDMLPLKIYTELPAAVTRSELPEQLEVDAAGERTTLPVVWTVSSGNLDGIGPVSLTGEVEGLDKTVSWNTVVYPENTKYLIDCGMEDQKKESEIYQAVNLVNPLKNKTADREASDSTDTWGRTGAATSKAYDPGKGLYSTGWYGENGKNAGFSYRFVLEKGEYEITTGHTEWWNDPRRTIVTAKVGDEEETLLGTAEWGKNKKGTTVNVTGTIQVPEDNTEVVLSFTAGGDKGAAVSYIVIAGGPQEPERDVVGIHVEKLPDKTVYQIGEELEPDGMVVVASVSNAEPIVLQEDQYQTSELDSSSEGEKIITVSFQEKNGPLFTDEFVVTVRDDEITDEDDANRIKEIRIARNPDKMKYQTGEAFDPAGMVVRAVRKATDSNATESNAQPAEQELSLDALEYEYDFSAPGKTDVTVIYTEEDGSGEERSFKASVEVEVYSAEEEYYTVGIMIRKKPDKLLYKTGEAFDPEGMIVAAKQKASPSNAARTISLSDEDLEYQYDFGTPGEKTVRILYTDVDKKQEERTFRTSLSVTVTVRRASGSDDSGSYGSSVAASGSVYRDEKKGTINSILGIVTGSGDGFSSWNQNERGWRLFYADGTMAAGSQTDDGRGGRLEQVAWERVNGAWYPFGADGYLKTGFIYDHALGGWFYVDVNRGMLTGWQTIDGKQYFFSTSHDGKGGMLAEGMTPPESAL